MISATSMARITEQPFSSVTVKVYVPICAAGFSVMGMTRFSSVEEKAPGPDHSNDRSKQLGRALAIKEMSAWVQLTTGAMAGASVAISSLFVWYKSIFGNTLKDWVKSIFFMPASPDAGSSPFRYGLMPPSQSCSGTSKENRWMLLPTSKFGKAFVPEPPVMVNA